VARLLNLAIEEQGLPMDEFKEWVAARNMPTDDGNQLALNG
jgi:hypothetical protein